jgi:hypothetical protein
MIPVMLWHPVSMTALFYAIWIALGLAGASGWLGNHRQSRRRRIYRTDRQRLANEEKLFT